MRNDTIKLGKLEVDLGELREFIVLGKKNGYAGDGKEQVLPDGSRRFIFQKGSFIYIDEYNGNTSISGHESIRKKGQLIWRMSYNAITSLDKDMAEKAFAFLKEKLFQVTSEFPFRGPEGISTNGNFVYENHSKIDPIAEEVSKRRIGCPNNLFGVKGYDNIGVLFNGRVFFKHSGNYFANLIIPKE